MHLRLHRTKYRGVRITWLSERLQKLHRLRTGVTAVLHWAIYIYIHIYIYIVKHFISTNTVIKNIRLSYSYSSSDDCYITYQLIWRFSTASTKSVGTFQQNLLFRCADGMCCHGLALVFLENVGLSIWYILPVDIHQRKNIGFPGMAPETTRNCWDKMNHS